MMVIPIFIPTSAGAAAPLSKRSSYLAFGLMVGSLLAFIAAPFWLLPVLYFNYGLFNAAVTTTVFFSATTFIPVALGISTFISGLIWASMAEKISAFRVTVFILSTLAVLFFIPFLMSSFSAAFVEACLGRC